jgi:hypothetical protein
MSVTLNGQAFKCEDTHSLIIDSPMEIATRDFFSWGQKGQVQIYGGQTSRDIYIYCWIHHPEIQNLLALDSVLLAMDQRTGEFGRLLVSASGSVMRRENCRFMGFERIPFPGQDHAGGIPVIGPNTTTYGGWHIAGNLHFRQLALEYNNRRS